MADAGVVRRRFARALLGALLLLTGPAAAQFGPPIGQPLIGIPGYAPSTCRFQPRVFETLKYGPSMLCRPNMKYRPGALECVQIFDQICGSFTANGQWIEGYTTATVNYVACPAGPPLPMCPQIGAGGIRRGLRYR